MIKKSHAGKLLLTSIMMLSALSLASCGEAKTSTSSQTSVETSTSSSSQGTVKVQEINLALSKTSAKVGETIDVTVSFKPTTATNKQYSLASGDETIAKIQEGKVVCVARGQVIITARSTENPLKKSEATLTVLGTDDQGRTENIFEAENANLVKVDGSTMNVETGSDERISGGALVGSVKQGDRLIWGVTASGADANASLHFRLMGPSGWGGMWNSIDYTFADWYTVKVNGHTVNTENVSVAGTYNNAGSADYYNFSDVIIGDISLIQGLNVVTFVVSNRFDVTKVSDDKFNGNISTMGNIDSMTIFSSKDLTYTADTAEVDNADPDVSYQTLKMESEASTTRVYKDESTPLVDMTGKTMAEFEAGLNVMFGVKSTGAAKVKLNLHIAAPYKTATEAMTDVNVSDLLSINIGGKEVSVAGLTIAGNNAVGNKTNYSTVITGWVDLADGDNTISVVVNSDVTGFAYLGGLDYLELDAISGTFTPFLIATPEIKKTVTFEAEADTTKRVGYADLATGATYVELINATKTQTDKYKNKLDTTKIIYGIESSTTAYASVSLTMSTPYVDANTVMADVSAGDLGDLWFNGTLVSTPNTLAGNSKKGVKDNFTTTTITTQIKLEAGKNRLAWEPRNYTSNTYAFFGAMDNIQVTTTATVTPYEVNMWTDRNTYFDDNNSEPIYVTCDSVSATSPSTCWIGLYNKEDNVEANQPGSLYWYYPTMANYNTDGQEYLGKACDITKQNPNSQRPLISGEHGGYFKIVYMEKDSNNAASGYDVTDTVYISCWNDPDNGYGGLVA